MYMSYVSLRMGWVAQNPAGDGEQKYVTVNLALRAHLLLV